MSCRNALIFIGVTTLFALACTPSGTPQDDAAAPVATPDASDAQVQDSANEAASDPFDATAPDGAPCIPPGGACIDPSLCCVGTFCFSQGGVSTCPGAVPGGR